MELFLDTKFQIGQTIKDDFKIFAITNYSIVDLTRVALVTENSDKSRLWVIDEEAVLLLSEKFEKTIIATKLEKSSLIKTNVFQDSIGIQLHDLKIPKLVKTSTMGFTMGFTIGLTSELEYINAMEYLIGEKALIV
jgi:hypothetical protein